MKSNKFMTVMQEAHLKNKVGLCRFFGSVKPVANEEEAQNFIQIIKAKYPDASHHVWAYRIGINNKAVVRYSDDGEPVNSAGLPVAKAIDGCDITNVVVVITRYYGGVNQGVGGLIRAYGRTATLVLNEAGRVEHEAFQLLEIRPVSYAQLGDVIHHVEKQRGSIKNIIYDADVKVIALLKPQLIDNFKTIIRDLTRGAAELSLGDFIWQKVE